MSRKGNCSDNEGVESYFGSSKKERIRRHLCKDHALAIEDIADDIKAFYNQVRRHSRFGGGRPDEFEVNAQRRRDRFH